MIMREPYTRAILIGRRTDDSVLNYEGTRYGPDVMRRPSSSLESFGGAARMTVTLITGGNKGLGYETARQLVERGHHVYVGARNVERGQAAASELGAQFVQ